MAPFLEGIESEAPLSREFPQKPKEAARGGRCQQEIDQNERKGEGKEEMDTYTQ
jgi:hypothetical protein